MQLGYWNGHLHVFNGHLEPHEAQAVIKLIYEASAVEREACAKIAEEWGRTSDRLELKTASISTHYCERIAAAIRARGIAQCV